FEGLPAGHVRKLLAAQNIASGKDVRDVRSQPVVNRDAAGRIRDAGTIESEILNIRSTPCGDQEGMTASLAVGIQRDARLATILFYTYGAATQPPYAVSFEHGFQHGPRVGTVVGQ